MNDIVENYIDVRDFPLVYIAPDGQSRISMAKFREAIDAYEATELPVMVYGILMTPSQYGAYERTIYDGMLLLGVVEGTPIPVKLKFNGITIKVK